MAVVDYERAWLRLKEVIGEKGSHGQRDLFTEMAGIEVECSIPEGDENFDAAPPAPRRRARSRPATTHPRVEARHG